MYAVRRWDEEVIKLLAVGMVLGLLAMAVMPLAVGDAWLVYRYYYLKVSGDLGLVLDFFTGNVYPRVVEFIVGMVISQPVGLAVSIALAG